MRRALRPLALACAFALAGCVHNTIWTAESPTSDEEKDTTIRVKVDEIYSQGGHLWVSTEIINGGNESVLVARDDIYLVLPSGRWLRSRRAHGQTTIAVPAGDIRKVNFDFEDSSLDWDRMPPLTIDFADAVTTTLKGTPVKVPKIVAHP